MFTESSAGSHVWQCSYWEPPGFHASRGFRFVKRIPPDRSRHGMHLSRAEWKNTLEDMVRMGAQVPPDWVDPIVDYLALNFPEKSEPAGSRAHGIGVSMEIVRAGVGVARRE
jgi:hypothetical protein